MKLESISPSRIAAYLACPRRFAFRYVEDAPAAFRPATLAFGSAVHSALETFHMERLAGRTPLPAAIETLFLVDWHAALAQGLAFKEGEDADSLARLGARLVAAYMAAVPEDLGVVAVEAPFQVPLADPATGEVLGPDLMGIFDLFAEGDTIVELKTAARAFDHGTLARHLQLSAYAFAYRSIHGTIPKLRVVALMKQKTPKVAFHEATRDLPELRWWARLAAEVCRAIEAEVFPPSPGWMCDGCEYARPCASWQGRTLLPVRRVA